MRPQLCRLLALVSILAVSCARHKITQPSGEIIQSTTVLAKGGLTTTPDGGIVMFTDASDAAKELGDYARAALMIGLWKTGINAASDLGETITQEVAK